MRKSLPKDFLQDGRIYICLYQPHFTSAYRVAQTINKQMGKGTAIIRDVGSMEVEVPQDSANGVVAVAHKGLKIEIASRPTVSQPKQFSLGQTAISTAPQGIVSEQGGSCFPFPHLPPWGGGRCPEHLRAQPAGDNHHLPDLAGGGCPACQAGDHMNQEAAHLRPLPNQALPPQPGVASPNYL